MGSTAGWLCTAVLLLACLPMLAVAVAGSFVASGGSVMACDGW